MRKQTLAAWSLTAVLLASAPDLAAQETPLPRQEWSFEGVFGTYDLASAQRGFQVYKEICSACHPVKHLHFRDLAGIGYNADEIKAIETRLQKARGDLPIDIVVQPLATRRKKLFLAYMDSTMIGQ